MWRLAAEIDFSLVGTARATLEGACHAEGELPDLHNGQEPAAVFGLELKSETRHPLGLGQRRRSEGEEDQRREGVAPPPRK
jgi:hypothetical protein